MATFHEKTKDLLRMLGGAIVIAGSAVWALSHQIHSMETRLTDKVHEVDKRLGDLIGTLDKRITVIETVLVMQGYPAKNLAVNTVGEN